MGTDTEDELRRLRAAVGANLSSDRRRLRSFLGLPLRLRLRLRLAECLALLPLALRLRLRLRLRLLAGERRRRWRSLLRLKRRSSRGLRLRLRAFALSALVSFLLPWFLESSDDGDFRRRSSFPPKSRDLDLDTEESLRCRRFLRGGDRDELRNDTDRRLFRSRRGEGKRDEALRLMEREGLRLDGLLRFPRSGDTELLPERRRRRGGGDRDDDGLLDGEWLGDLDGRRPLRGPDGT